jgi:hypothetical protein
MTDSTTKSPIINLGNEDLSQLINQVQEKVVTTNEKTQFSAAELWNIQKRFKTATRQQTRWILN